MSIKLPEDPKAAKRRRSEKWLKSPNGKAWASEYRARPASVLLRRAQYLKAYGLTNEHYEALVLAQNNRCAICGALDRSVRGYRLSVDHDHITGKVRGLLCTKCNAALGHLGDTLESLQKVVDYLRGAL